jgi:SWI/SNF-related matrix-associated actin-dependent regulator 1 of chromatin subfamily A
MFKTTCLSEYCFYDQHSSAQSRQSVRCAGWKSGHCATRSVPMDDDDDDDDDDGWDLDALEAAAIVACRLERERSMRPTTTTTTEGTASHQRPESTMTDAGRPKVPLTLTTTTPPTPFAAMATHQPVGQSKRQQTQHRSNARWTVEFVIREPGDRFEASTLARDGADARRAAHAVVASVAGAMEDDERGSPRWMFPSSSLREAREAFANANFAVVMTPGMVIRAADARFDEHERTADEVYETRVPKELDAKMFEFQRQGVMYALRRGGRVLIGDEMGLGKTVQACALLAVYRDELPALILVPTSLREAWRNALQSWLDVEDRDIACVGATNEAKKLDGSTYDIVPYSLVVKLKERLAAKRYRVIVCDESHFIKDRRAQRTQAVMPLLKASRRTICLTGTPALSRPIELFTHLEALASNVFPRLNEFGARYCAGGGPFGMYTGASNLEELHVMISKLCMVRRLKKDVLKDLPPKQRSQVFLAPEKSAMGEVNGIRKRLDKLRENPAGTDSFEEKRLINELYAASAKAKTKVVCEYLDTLIEGSADGKYLFFAHHTVMLDAVEEFLRKKKVQSIRIDGTTPADARGKLVDTFQREAACRVAVLSIKAAGMGLTLTAASTVVFGEMVWTPGDLVQAEDRAHRIGQLSSVLVQYLHVKDSIDDIIWMSVGKKMENLGVFLNGQSGVHLEATRGRALDGSQNNSAGKSPKKQKRNSSHVVDVSQRTLLELFQSQQSTQKTEPAGEDQLEEL